MSREKNDANLTAVIHVNAKLQELNGGEKPPAPFAYAFTANGRFLAQAPLDEQGNAKLTVPAAAGPQEVRVVVGPPLEEAQTAQNPSAVLARKNAPTQLVRVSASATDVRAIFEIPQDIWICWLRRCRVRGTLLKRLFSSGVALDYPVIHADVQIWEVDPIYILLSQLSDVQLDRVSKYLLNPQPLPPGPDPDPLILGVRHAQQLGQVEVAKAVPQIREFTTAAPEFEGAHRAASAGNLQALRHELTLIDPNAVRYLICLLFPRLVRKALIGTTSTDRCGRFDTYIFPGCYDTPDLYFTASVQFVGFTLTIYAPTPVSCYTFWNYQCGRDVTLYTSSIFAPLGTPCAPVDAPENYVLVRALGNIQLNRIYGASSVLAGSTNATNIGLVDDIDGQGHDGPFGGVILPRIEFDGALRAFDRARYYQVSWRQGTSGAFHVLTGAVSRKYNHYVGGELVTSVYPLGPKSNPDAPGTNLFEIPTALAPEGDWDFPNPPVDHANAVFPTAHLPSELPGGTHGKYQLKLDLFDSAGNPIDIAAANIRFYVPTTTDPDGTIHTVDAATLGLVAGNSFIMTVHVDNRPTAGLLGTPQLNGVDADDCGVFRYGEGHSGTVTIPFTASHPDSFATYSYRVTRGATPLPTLTQSGQVSSGTNPATVTASVLQLLTQPDGSICDIAGFSQDLYVAALATDGWSRQSHLDSNPAPTAFVLAPEE